MTMLRITGGRGKTVVAAHKCKSGSGIAVKVDQMRFDAMIVRYHISGCDYEV